MSDEAAAIPGDQRLDGRVAIVVGGGWNIGRALAERLARAGAAVVLASRHAERLERVAATINDAGGKALAIPVDATEPSSVQQLVAQTQQQLGAVDVLVVAAGNSGTQRALVDTDPAELQSVIRDNLLPSLLCSREVLPSMLDRDRGEILTLVGGGAFFPELRPGLVAYATAKAGLCRFVDQLQAEVLDTGVRVHGLEPGLVLDADALARIAREEVDSGQLHPLRRHNRSAEDAANLGLWLVSEASRPLRGRVLSVSDELADDPAARNAIEASLQAYRVRRANP